jgi:hypothetical protein
MIADGIDRAKARAGLVDVVVVGGGAPLVGQAVEGAGQVIRPDHGQVANAIGAAIPQVRREIMHLLCRITPRRGDLGSWMPSALWEGTGERGVCPLLTHSGNDVAEHR